jgi:hypothetical protein
MEFPDTELNRRLRANRGRLLRPDLSDRFERSFRYRPASDDFLDVRQTDGLLRGLRERRERPSVPTVATWPDAQRDQCIEHLQQLGRTIGDEHVSYLYLQEWEYLGALRVQTAALLLSIGAFWEEGEQLSLLTEDLADVLLLDHNEWDLSCPDDEYEVRAWGAFVTSP